ncbi:MAG: hypothetical protein ACI89J_003062, partial [Hyphomicrobiaceae bacterium]
VVSIPICYAIPKLCATARRVIAQPWCIIRASAPADMRRRALEVYFANQSKRMAAVEIELGFPLTSQIQRRRIGRAAQILRSMWSAFDKALSKPALRAALVKKHGDGNDEALKRRMLLAALREKPSLMSWIKKHHGIPTEANVREVLIDVSRLHHPLVK